MAETTKTEDKPAAAAPEKPSPAPAKAPAPKAKIVEETGRYVCRAAIMFTDDRGRRASARKGEVVSLHPEDVAALRRAGAIAPETTEE